MSKFTELKFFKVSGIDYFNRIPKYLFEQMRHKDFDVERVYQYAPQFLPSPQTWFYVLINAELDIKGILWATTELVQNVLIVNMLSVDEQYQSGDSMKVTTDFLFKEIKKTSLRAKMYWIQKRYRALSRLGWKNTGRMMMEISQES